MASGDQVFFSKINILSCVYEMSCYDDDGCVVVLYSAAIIPDNKEWAAECNKWWCRQAGSHHWYQKLLSCVALQLCAVCRYSIDTQFYEDGLCCASWWYRTFVQSQLNFYHILSYFWTFKIAIKYVWIRLCQFKKSKNPNSMDIFLVGSMAYHG